MPRFLHVVVPLAALTVVSACGDDDDAGKSAKLSDEATIEYTFTDAAVAPEADRSYTLTITRSEVEAAAEFHGTTSAPVPAEVWTKLVDNVSAVSNLSIEAHDDGCTGGTGRALTVNDRGEKKVDQSFDVCGGRNDAAADQLDMYVAPARDAIPNLDSIFQ